MKTLQELYREIKADETLKTAFLEAAKDGKTADFLAAHGCEATAEDLSAFLNDLKNREITDEELDDVSGGACNKITAVEVWGSIVGLGVTCATYAIYSAVNGHVGQETDEEGRICTEDK